MIAKNKMEFLVFMQVLYTVGKGFKAPPELVTKAGNPRIRVLVIKGHGSEQKDRGSDDGTGDCIEHMWEGRDNKVMEMVPMIVHMWCYMISKEREKKWVAIDTHTSYKVVCPRHLDKGI